MISKHSFDYIFAQYCTFSISDQTDSLILGVKGFQIQSIFQTSVKMGDLEVTPGKVQGGILNPSVRMTQILCSVAPDCKDLFFSVSSLALLPAEKGHLL